MATGTRLAIGTSVILSVTAYMAGVGVSSSWQYYLSVDECLADASILIGAPLRVSGKIAPDSLRVLEDRLQATFRLEGTQGALRVRCAGQLPDNLAEGQQVVVEGRLASSRELMGSRLMTRCASKYSSQDRPRSSHTSTADGPQGSG